eukprot:scaffold801_cov178-Ochromonas_danica.AAC.21
MFKVLFLLLSILSLIHGKAWVFDLQIEENPNDNNNNNNNNNRQDSFAPPPPPPRLPCQKEMHDFCSLDNKKEMKNVDEFDARMCLRAYRDLISDECSLFLVRHPSIVEPCYQEISTFCVGVEAGNRRILNCLLQQDYAGFSRECQLALKAEDDEEKEDKKDTNNMEVEEDNESEPSNDIIDIFPQQDDDDLLGLRDPLEGSDILDQMFDEDDDYYDEDVSDDEELDDAEAGETSFFRALIDELAIRIAQQVAQLEQIISQYVGAVQSRNESSKNDTVSVHVSGNLRGLTFDLQRASPIAVGTTAPSTSNS